MNTNKFLYAIIIATILTSIIGCAASKEYTSKVFSNRNEEILKDSLAKEIKFLELDSLQPNDEDWVSTDIIMGRDTGSKTIALDNLAKIYPAKEKVATDSALNVTKTNETVIALNNSKDSIYSKSESTDVIVMNKQKDTVSKTNEVVPRDIVIAPERTKRTRDNQ